MKSFKQYSADRPDEIFLTEDGITMRLLTESGKWVSGRFENNIRIDRVTHLLKGDQHAHVFGRNGDTVGVLNFDGTKSHGGQSFKLHKRDAGVLRQLGWQVPKDDFVEWILFDGASGELLLE